MNYFGGLILLAYAAITFLGFEPFGADERGAPPPGVRRGPSGTLFWDSGYRRGK